MREQFVKSGEWKLTSSKIEKSIEEFNKYHTRKPRWNLEYPWQFLDYLMKSNPTYSVITYRFLLRREPTFYLVNVIVPCFQIIFLGKWPHFSKPRKLCASSHCGFLLPRRFKRKSDSVHYSSGFADVVPNAHVWNYGRFFRIFFENFLKFLADKFECKSAGRFPIMCHSTYNHFGVLFRPR